MPPTIISKLVLCLLRLFAATVFMLGLGFSNTTFGQNGSLSGTLLQSDSITPLAYANIWLKGSDKGTTSNEQGKFRINFVPVGEYQVEISSVGYTTWTTNVKIEEGEEVQIKAYLSASVQDLNTVLITGSPMTGGEEGIKTLAGSAYYLSPKQIERFSYSDANRTLRSVPGVNLQEEDGFGLRPNIGLRGTGVERSAKITIMEDGVLMAPAPYIAPAAYYFPTMGRMQAVEVLKGSSQIKYGPHTTGGAINLISSQIPDKLKAKVMLLGGTNLGRNVHALVGSSHGRVSYMAETFQYGSDGFKQLDNGGNTGFYKQDYLGKVRFSSKPKAKKKQSLTLKLGKSLENSNETYLGLTEEDFSSTPYRRYAASQKDFMETEQSQVSLGHEIELSKKTILSTTIYRNDLHRNWYKLENVADSTGTLTSIANILDDPTGNQETMGYLTGVNSSDDALLIRANNRTYYAQGLQTNLTTSFGKKEFEQSLEIGLRIHQDQIDRFQWVDGYRMDDGNMFQTSAGTPGTESNRIETATAFAGFVQYRVQKGKFALKPGLRYERIFMQRKDYGKNDPDRTGIELSERNNLVEVWIPGIALEHFLSDQVFLFAGVHKGFTPPGTKEGTRPEESWNYEVGSRWNAPGLDASLVFFYNNYSNLLGVDLAAAGGEGSTDLFNAGKAQTYGLEFSFSYNLLAKSKSNFSLPLLVNYTYTMATFGNDFSSTYKPWGNVQSGDRFPYLAPDQLTVQLALEHTKFAVSLNAKYTSQMRTFAGQHEIPVNTEIAANIILDASASYKINPQIRFFGSISNMLNTVYLVSRRPAGLRPGLSRTIMAGIKVDI